MSRLPRKVAAGLRCLAQGVPRFVELLNQDAGSVRHFQRLRGLRYVHERNDLQCSFGEARLGVRLAYGFKVKARPRFVRHGYACYGTAAASVERREGGIGEVWSVAALLQDKAVLLQDEHDLSIEGALEAEDCAEKEKFVVDCTYVQTERVQERVQFLRELGLSEKNLTALQCRSKCSLRAALLQTSLRKIMQTVSFLTDEVGLSKSQAANCLYHDVYLGSSSVDGSLRPKVFSLNATVMPLECLWNAFAVMQSAGYQIQVQYFRELGFSDQQLVKLICRRPQVLTCHLERTILPMTRKLTEIGLKDEDIVKVYLKSPGFLRTGKEKIDQIVEFMHGFGAVDLPKIFRTTPKMFDLSLDGKVLQTTQFFRDDLQFTTVQMNRVVRWPQVFNYSVDNNLRLKVDYFRSLGLSREAVASMIASFPCMLGLNLERSIKPKVDYLVLVLKKDVNELVLFPVYLSYSLWKRIQPRYDYAKSVGCTFQKLSYWLSCGDDEFFRRVNIKLAKLREKRREVPLPVDSIAGVNVMEPDEMFVYACDSGNEMVRPKEVLQLR